MLIDLVSLASRWLHVLSVILLVGGTLFMRLALVPASEGDAIGPEAREAIRKRWAKWIGISVLFLLASGLYNAAVKATDYRMNGIYLTLLSLKIVLGFVLFFLVSVINGRSERAVRWRTREKHWLNIICSLMVCLVLIAGYMKMSPQSPKEPKAPAPAADETV